MSILYGISVIAICTCLFYGAEGQSGSCDLTFEDGTALSDTEWSFGVALDTIEDVTPAGTVLLNMTASNINLIRSSTPGGDSGYIFMDAVLEDGQFILTLSEYFARYEDLETSSTMRMSVIFGCSVNNRTLELAQPITDTNNHYPEFQNAPYTYELPMPFPSGFAVQLFGEISARDVDLTNTLISFTLNSTDPDAAGFSASWLSQSTTDTKLHYAQLLTTTLLSLEKSVTFQIYATDNGNPTLTSETSITISVDEVNSTPNNPIFTYPIYIADHSGLTIEEASGSPIAFNQGNVSLSQGYDSTVVYKLTDNIGSYEDNFEITISEDYRYIGITLRNVDEAFLAEKHAILTLTATRTGATSSGVTILFIDLPGSISCITTTESDTTTVQVTTESNTSESTVVTESSTDCPTVTTEECVCDCSTTTDGYTTTTENGNGVTTSSDNAVTSETTECPVVTVTQECYCTTADDTWGSTSSSSDGDSSVTTTAATPNLSFSSNIYRFEKDSTFIGVLMTQTAVATNAEGTIRYAVTFDDADLASRVMIDVETAELKVTATISPGIYTFQIIATIEDLNLSASATVVLVISTLTDCSGEIVFGYALNIIELDEESAHENILPLDENGCSYTIYSQTPSQDLFYMNNNYLNTIAIDREASYFSEMSVAQVRVIIDANCPNGTGSETAITRSKRNTEYEVLTENIAYDRTRTILVVIIKDINDNPPIWNSDTPTYVGFPSYELAQLIHVPYVYQFTATDADIDDNANVRYILPSGSDEVFYIHDSEGSLYIQQGAYIEDNSKFTIIATDGLFETPTEFTVRTLESSNVVVLFITGGVLEDVEDIVKDLSTSTGYWISSLGSAVISESDTPSSRSLRTITNRAKRASDANTLLRLVVYGLENNEPVSSESLVSNFKDADLTWAIFESATLEAILSDNAIITEITETDTRGYWAAIIVLSVLLFMILIAVGVVYFLFYRPRNSTSIASNVTYENFDNRSSNGSTGEHYMKSVTFNDSQENSTESTDSPSGDWTTNQTKNPEKSFLEANRTFNPIKGGNDGDFVFVTRNESSTDTSSNPSKRKSVAFNTTVEEIEVARL